MRGPADPVGAAPVGAPERPAGHVLAPEPPAGRGPAPRTATPADAARMAQVLAAAFARDPVLTWVVPPGAPDRDARLRALFTLELPRSTALGGAWTAAGGEAPALWYPPGRGRPAWSEMLTELPYAARALGRHLPRGLRVMTTLHRDHPVAAHWYLAYLGTEPARQGQGIGASLLRPVLTRCDRDRVGAYLEASTEGSRRLYEAHGFRVTQEFRLPRGGPRMWRMWRDPR